VETQEWRIRFRGEPGGGGVAYARGHQFAVGDPVSFDPLHSRITALEYLLAALAADLAGSLRRLAPRHRIVINDLEVAVKGMTDRPLVFLGVVGEEGEAGLDRIEVKVYVETGSSAEEVRTLWQGALRVSAIARMLGGSTRLELELRTA